MPETLSKEQLKLLDAYWRAANYFSVGQIYLYDNPLLKQAAQQEAHQAAVVRSLGNNAGPEFYLCPSQSGHQGARSRHDLHHRPGAWRTRAGRERLS